MNRTVKAFTFVLALLMMLTAAVMPFGAAQASFSPDAYSTIVTASDFQTDDAAAYNRFATVLGNMKKDGMPTPHSVLVGGDYTKILFDIATPGVVLIKNRYLSVYPDANPNSVVCIQGNHDNPSPAFAKTGLYDMGTYSLYCINEDSFPWLQYLRNESTVKKTASDLEATLKTLKDKGDTRPVIVLTHVPLHHTTRAGGGDNLYASYIFNVLNNAAKEMDIIFLFGHNHSSAYDDYIGGAANFLKAGDTIRIPDPAKRSEDTYKEEILNFTYTNCGYIGYSGNTDSSTSTSKLTATAIELCADRINFVRYGEDGLFSTESVKRLNEAGGSADTGASFESPVVENVQIILKIVVIEKIKVIHIGSGNRFQIVNIGEISVVGFASAYLFCLNSAKTAMLVGAFFFAQNKSGVGKLSHIFIKHIKINAHKKRVFVAVANPFIRVDIAVIRNFRAVVFINRYFALTEARSVKYGEVFRDLRRKFKYVFINIQRHGVDQFLTVVIAFGKSTYIFTVAPIALNPPVLPVVFFSGLFFLTVFFASSRPSFAAQQNVQLIKRGKIACEAQTDKIGFVAVGFFIREKP